MHIQGPLRAILLAAAVGASCTAQPTRGPVAVDAPPAQKPSPPAAAETPMPNRPYSGRIKPQQGIVYFVVGAGGQLRSGNIDWASPLTAKGFDTDYSFLIAEISGDELYFNAIARSGAVIDSGLITRRK